MSVSPSPSSEKKTTKGKGDPKENTITNKKAVSFNGHSTDMAGEAIVVDAKVDQAVSVSDSLAAEKVMEKPAKKDQSVGEVKGKTKEKKSVKKKRSFFSKFKPNISFPYFHISSGILLTIILIGGIFFSYTKLNQFTENARQSRSQLVAFQEKQTDLQQLAQNLASVESEAKIIDQSFPDEEGVVGFIRLLKAISSNVSLNVFDFVNDQPVADQAGQFYIDFNLEVAGSYENVELFLFRFINFPYLIDIKLIDLTGVESDDSRLILSARLYVNPSFF